MPFELMSFDKRDKHGVVFILSFRTVCKIQFIFQSIKQVSTKNLEIFLVPRSWHVCTMQLNCEFKSPLWAVNATVWTMGGVFVRISRLLQMNLKMVNRKRPWILWCCQGFRQAITKKSWRTKSVLIIQQGFS